MENLILYSYKSGIILVHDLTNRNSFTNLKDWLNEVSLKVNQTSYFNWRDDNTNFVIELEMKNSYNNASIPILVIGNKLDALRSPAPSRIKNILPSSKMDLEIDPIESVVNSNAFQLVFNYNFFLFKKTKHQLIILFLKKRVHMIHKHLMKKVMHQIK